MRCGLEISTKVGWVENKQRERHVLPFYTGGFISQNIGFQCFAFNMTVLVGDMLDRGASQPRE